MVKLLDFLPETAILSQSVNLFAPIVLAHLMTIKTAGKPIERCHWKTELIRGLYRRGLTASQVRQLVRVIDWLMELPPEVSIQFKHDHALFEQENKMPYMTSFEQISRDEGLDEGFEKGLVAGQIQLLQQLLNIEESKKEALVQLEIADLEKMRNELHAHFQQHRSSD